MSAITQNNGLDSHTGLNIEMRHFNGFFLLLFASTVIFAQAGITKLPESYRTPLSEMVNDDPKEWRTEPEDENPWRKNDEDLIVKPRIKAEFFPRYNYHSLENPISKSLLQNENEIERPVSNILEFSF